MLWLIADFLFFLSLSLPLDPVFVFHHGTVAIPLEQCFSICVSIVEFRPAQLYIPLFIMLMLS